MIDKRDGNRKKPDGKPQRPLGSGPIDSTRDGPPTEKPSGDKQENPAHSVGDGGIVRATWALVFLTGILSIATIILGVAAFFQWRELRSTDLHIAEQVKITADQLKVMRAGQRAWISIGSIDIGGPLEFDGDKAKMTLKLVLKNTGNLPALRINPVLHLYPGQELSGGPPSCREGTPNETFGMALFPNESSEQFNWRWFATTEAGGETTPIPKSGIFGLSVVGCVLYESAGARQQYATAFTGFLTHRSVNPEHHSVFDRAKTLYEAEELFFTRYPGLGMEAN